MKAKDAKKMALGVVAAILTAVPPVAYLIQVMSDNSLDSQNLNQTGNNTADFNTTDLEGRVPDMDNQTHNENDPSVNYTPFPQPEQTADNQRRYKLE